MSNDSGPSARLARSLRAAGLAAAAGLCVPLPGRADDALILPPGVSRVYAVPTWTTVSTTWDAGGKRREIPPGSGRISSFNLGFAVEYGVTSWITAGFQWTPGPNLSSSFDFPATDPAHRDRATLDDAFDALAGVKVALVGSTGRSPARTTGLALSDTVRLAVGLGAKFPLTSIDWDREARNREEGRPYLSQAVDRHLVAPVVGVYYDQVLLRNPSTELFVNLHSQLVPYLSRARYSETSLARHLDPALAGVSIDYRYDLYVEVEPRLERWVAPGALRVGLYAPARCRFFPETALDGAGQGGSGYRAVVTPTLDLLTPVLGIPFELKIGYQTTFSGKNVPGGNSLIMVVRAMP